jgi:hypothetical protein
MGLTVPTAQHYFAAYPASALVPAGTVWPVLGILLARLEKVEIHALERDEEWLLWEIWN